MIEGDDTGIMGATTGWPKIPQNAEQYIERMDRHKINHDERQLKQRLQIVNDRKERITTDKYEYSCIDHTVITLSEGQTFGEEAIMFKDHPSMYSVTVSSEKAVIWTIDEFQFNRRLMPLPNVKDSL